MLLSIQRTAWLAVGLLLSAVTAQDTSPGGPVHPGQPSNCNGWHTVVSGDNCQNVPARYGITFAQFLAWNPAVSSDCVSNFWLESAYCVRVGTTAVTTTTTTSTTASPTATSNPSVPDTSPGGPVHPGQPDNCNGWHTVATGDNCQNVPARYGITLAQFLAWNPAVSSDCVSNFWLQSAYCVRTGERATTSSTTVPPTITSAPGSSTSSWFNSTYSTQHPVTSWNVTATSIDREWPPTKTLEGQSDRCNAYHRVQPGDTCERLKNQFGLVSVADFLSWNPAAEEDCDMLIADYYVCVGVQRESYNTDLEWETELPDFTPPPEPTEHTPTTEPTADASFTPSPSHGPMPSNCRVFHQAEADQNCNDIVGLYGNIDQQQFFAWNPVLNNNCNGLWLDTWYCVGAYSADEYPLPAHQTTKPTSGTIPVGYPNDCARWYQTSVDDTCDLIVQMFGSFSRANFLAWNPSVYADCGGIVQQAWYCVGRRDTPTTRTDGAPTPTEDPPTSRPTQSGIIAGCTDFWLVGDDDTCTSIARGAGITVDNLYSWNGALTVGTCAGLEVDYYVCVGIDGDEPTGPQTTTTQPATSSSTQPVTTTTTTTTTNPGTPVQTPSPVREGMVQNCVRFYLQQPGDLCWSMAQDAGISLSQFIEWNPAVGAECFNLWPDYFYCIGVSGPATTITQGPPVPT